MFIAITQPRFQRKQGNEYLWSFGEDRAPTAILAGAVLGSEIIRVRLIRGPNFDEARYQLTDGGDGTLPYHSWIVAKGDEQWRAPDDEAATRAMIEPYLQGFALSDTHLRLTQRLSSHERIYGLGEHTGDLDKRLQSFSLWNIDPPPPYDETTLALYSSIPFYTRFQMDEGRASGVLIDATGRIEMDFGKTNERLTSITLEGDSLIVYFFMGPTSAEVLRQYAELTGPMPLPARWTLGHHQCRWSYGSEQLVRDLATRLRERQHPCDAIWLDIDYMNGFRNFTWNPDTFPDPARLTADLHEKGLHLVTIIDPGTKIDDDYHVYKECIEQDYLCRDQDGERFVGSVWPGECIFPDFSREAVRAWWGNLYTGMLDQGVDAIWNDMNEPALTKLIRRPEEDTEVLYSKTMDRDVLNRAGGDQPTGPDGPSVLHKYFHNAYGMEMARATYEGLMRLRPDTRPFVLTRSGTAGVQRYAAVWTGDNTSRWEYIHLGIRMCLDLGMSGVPFVGTDIGGFWGNSNGELLVRFAQLGALLPFSRNHNAIGNIDQEPWAFGESYEQAYRKAIETRYRLLPYLYTLFQQAASDGSPILRPLFYHYPNDELAHEAEDEFLLGDSLLCAPVTQAGAQNWDVYLPEGLWFDYWDGTEYPGEGVSNVPAPLDRWPLFIRGNSILPSGPVMQHVDQQATDPLTFSCYMATDGLASYTLYEDDGSTLAYRNGAFAKTTISCRVIRDSVVVRIDEQHSNYRPQREAYEIVVYSGSQVLRQRVKAGQGSVVVTL